MFIDSQSQVQMVLNLALHFKPYNHMLNQSVLLISGQNGNKQAFFKKLQHDAVVKMESLIHVSLTLTI